MLPLVISVKGKLQFNRSNASFRFLKSLENALTLTRIVNGQRVKTKFIETEKSGVVNLPRGAINIVQKIARQQGLKLHFVSKVKHNKNFNAVDLSIELRPYQDQCVQKLLRSVQGFAVLPCGSGKTVIGCSTILKTGQAGIVFVHTSDLLDQWSETLNWISGGQIKIRKIGGGLKDFSPLEDHEVAVCMVQTIERAGQLADPLLGSSGVVMVDEVHHLPATTWLETLNRCPSRYRFGLTATPERSDGLEPVIRLAIGQEVFKMTSGELVDLGFLMKPIVQPVQTGVDIEIEKCLKRDNTINYSAAVSSLMKSNKRKKIIVALASLAFENGRSVLILLPRKKSTVEVSAMLNKAGFSAVSLTSQTALKNRSSILKRVRQGERVIICATQLADEGLDLPCLDTLINASAGKAQGRAIQRAGRIMRIQEGKKKPIVFDLVDGQPFLSQWRSRLVAYRSEIGTEPLDPVDPKTSAKLILENNCFIWSKNDLSSS